MDEDGRNPGLWAFSVTMFFSIILAVTIRLCVTQRLFNIFHFICIIFLSLLLYYGYNWLSNYFSFSKTYLTSVQLHTSPQFYLTIFLCAGFILVCELFIETIFVNLWGSPSEYMRKVVNDYKHLPPDFEEEFNRLMLRKEEQFVRDDLQRERYNYKRRLARMKKLEEKLEKDRQNKAK